MSDYPTHTNILDASEMTMIDIRCSGCGKLLGRIGGALIYSIKCPRCHKLNEREGNHHE